MEGFSATFFFNDSLFQVCEGYGQTECSAIMAMTMPGDHMAGNTSDVLTLYLHLYCIHRPTLTLYTYTYT